MINEHLKPLSEQGRKNWDRIFKKKAEVCYHFQLCPMCNRTTEVDTDQLPPFMRNCVHCGEPLVFRKSVQG